MKKRRHVDNNSHRNIDNDNDADTKRSPVQRGGSSDKVKEISSIENMSNKGEVEVEDWVQERYKPEDDGNHYTREENIYSSNRSSYRNSHETYYSKEHDKERHHYRGNDTNGEQYYNSSHRDRKRTRHND